jgi:hypothetical protein
MLTSYHEHQVYESGTYGVLLILLECRVMAEAPYAPSLGQSRKSNGIHEVRISGHYGFHLSSPLVFCLQNTTADMYASHTHEIYMCAYILP